MVRGLTHFLASLVAQTSCVFLIQYDVPSSSPQGFAACTPPSPQPAALTGLIGQGLPPVVCQVALEQLGLACEVEILAAAHGDVKMPASTTTITLPPRDLWESSHLLTLSAWPSFAVSGRLVAVTVGWLRGWMAPSPAALVWVWVGVPPPRERSTDWPGPPCSQGHGWSW